MYSTTPPDDLDPRRRPRGYRRQFRAGSRMVAIPRVHDLLAALLVRLGAIR